MIDLDRFFWLVILCGVVLLSAFSDDEPTAPSLDFSLALEELDVSYGDDPLQTYDLHLPANRSPESTDVIIMIHGGAWIEGDKEDVAGLVDLLKITMPNHAIVNMNYRLGIDPNDLFGTHMQDVKSVVDKIAREHQSLGVSQEFAMTGASAGGHMTLLYSYAFNQDARVKVAGNIIGPTYFLDPSYTDGSNPSWTQTVALVTIATQVPLTDTDYYDRVSPLTYVNNSTIPTIQFLGDEDPLIPTTQGTLLKEALDNAAVANDLIIYEGEGHGWEKPDNWTDTAIRFRDFVAQHM